MPHDKRVSYGVAIAIWRGPRLLLIQRKGSHAEGHWALPGGWVDYGETALETVKREAREELGVEVEPSATLFGTREEVFPDRELQSLSLYFDATIIAGEPRIMEPHKCSAMRWVDPRNPEERPSPLFPGLESMLDEIALGMDGLEESNASHAT